MKHTPAWMINHRIIYGFKREDIRQGSVLSSVSLSLSSQLFHCVKKRFYVRMSTCYLWLKLFSEHLLRGMPTSEVEFKMIQMMKYVVLPPLTTPLVQMADMERPVMVVTTQLRTITTIPRPATHMHNSSKYFFLF